MGRAGRLGVFVPVAAVSGLLFINFCNLVYQCGCRSWWSGAAVSCNIHQAGVPHCPWCINGGMWGYTAFGVIVVVQAWLAFCNPGPGLLARLGLTLLAFPLLGGVIAVVVGWWTGYWSG